MNEIFVVGHLLTNRQSIITMKAHFSIIYINGTHKVVLNCYTTSIGWCFTSNGQYSKYIHADYTLTSGFFSGFFLREVLIASLLMFTYCVFALFVFVLCVVSCATCVLDCPFLIFSPVCFLAFIYSDYADRITSTYSFHY